MNYIIAAVLLVGNFIFWATVHMDLINRLEKLEKTPPGSGRKFLDIESRLATFYKEILANRMRIIELQSPKKKTPKKKTTKKKAKVSKAKKKSTKRKKVKDK